MTAHRVLIDTDGGNNNVDLQVNDLVLSQDFDGRNAHRIYAYVVAIDNESFTLIPFTSGVDLTRGRNWSRLGNSTNTERQAYINIDAEGENSPQISMFSKVDAFDKINSYENNRVLIGNLNEITDSRFPTIGGHGIVTDNAYIRGEFVLNSGDNVTDIFGGINTNILSIDNSIVSIGSDITGIKSDIITIDGTILAQGASITANKNGLTSLVGRVTSTEKGIITNTTSIGQNAAGIALRATTQTVNDLENRVDTNQAAITVNSDEIALRATSVSLNTLTDRVTDTEASIIVNSDEIALRATTNTVNTLTNRVTTSEASIVTNSSQIALRVLKADFNTLKNTVTTQGTSITANATAIGLRATTSIVNALTGRVSDNEGAITVNSDQIALRVTQTDFNNLAGTVSSQGTSITTNATNIALRATTSTVNTLTGRVTSAEGSITTNATNIALRVKQIDFNTLSSTVTTQGTSITQNATAIGLRVTQTDFNTLSGKVTTQGTAITQNTSNIGLRVLSSTYNLFVGDTNTELGKRANKATILAEINLSPEGVKIAGDRISISGTTTFSSGYDPTTKLATSDAGDLAFLDTVGNSKIENGAVTGAKIANTTITGGNIVTGTITATQINTTSIQAAVVTSTKINTLSLKSTKGTIGAWNIGTTSIYSGTYQGSNAFTTSGMTIHKDGAIRAKYFRVDTDGKMYGNYGEIGGFSFNDATTQLTATETNTFTSLKSGEIYVESNLSIVDGTIRGWNKQLSSSYGILGMQGATYSVNTAYQAGVYARTTSSGTNAYGLVAQGVGTSGKAAKFIGNIEVSGNIDGMKTVHGSFYSNTDGSQSVTITGLTNVRVCIGNMSGATTAAPIGTRCPNSGNTVIFDRDNAHGNGTIYYVAYGW